MQKHAWAGASTFKKPAKYIALARDLGLSALHLVINDMVGQTEATAFRMKYPRQQIVELAGEVAAAGIDVHLMVWAMPHPLYVEGMCNELVGLFNSYPAPPFVGLQFDCEGPWTHAVGAFAYAEAALSIQRDLIGPVKLYRGARPKPFRFGINGIGYASSKKLDALASVCDYLCPQLYVPMAGIDADDILRLCLRWREQIGETIAGGPTDLPVMVGLSGSKRGVAHARACVAATKALPQWWTGEAIWWNLYHLSKSVEMQQVLMAA